MTNDTTTLNGALQELGELMADNLTQQGVTSSASEGLTTLANKILDIQGGGGTVASISVTSSAQIIMSGGTSTLTVTALDSNNTGVSGVSLDIYKGSTKVDTVTTGSGGAATYTYTGTGAGDTSFYATDGTIQSETYVIEDCLLYGLDTSNFTVPSNTTFSSDGSKITASTSTSGEKTVYFGHTFSNTDNWVFETELATVTSPQSFAILFNDNSYYGGQYPTQTNKAFVNLGSNITSDHTFSAGDKYRVVRENGVTTAYINNDMIQSKTTSHKSSFKVGYYITNGRTQYYNKIKIKIL